MIRDMRQRDRRQPPAVGPLGWLLIAAILALFAMAVRVEPCDGHGCPPAGQSP